MFLLVLRAAAGPPAVKGAEDPAESQKCSEEFLAAPLADGGGGGGNE